MKPLGVQSLRFFSIKNQDGIYPTKTGVFQLRRTRSHLSNIYVEQMHILRFLKTETFDKINHKKTNMILKYSFLP